MKRVSFFVALAVVPIVCVWAWIMWEFIGLAAECGFRSSWDVVAFAACLVILSVFMLGAAASLAVQIWDDTRRGGF